MMVGNEVKAVVRAPAEGIETAPALLEIRALTRKPATPFSIPLRNINLTVRAGEVIGIAGVAGNGQGEFFESVSGEALQPEAGSVRIRGKDAGGMSITGRRLMGAAFVPEERLGHGAAPRMKLSENLLLSR
ncbi:ATP-binding cassette domain-containing protein, partial [Mesorhizobium sp. M4B.F.Ca.ET.017.02.2.1]